MTWNLKMAVLPKLIYRFDTIHFTIWLAFFAEMNKLILKFIWNWKGPRVAITIPKKNKVQGFTLPDFKIYYYNCSNQDSVVLA